MKKLILCFLLFAFARPASAQIIYWDVNPDTTVSTWNVFSFHLAKKNFSYGDTGTIDIWFHPFSPNEVQITTRENCQLMVNNTTANLPLALQTNDSINANKPWAQCTYVNLNKGNTQGLWLAGVTNKYVGIRFKLTKNGNWLYGWARLDVDATPNSFTIKDYAYNSQANAGFILAGQTLSGITEPAFSNTLKLYPNPGKGKFTIEQNFSNRTFAIYNVLGENIFNAICYNGKTEMDLSNMRKGIYFCKIISADGEVIATQKLLIE